MIYLGVDNGVSGSLGVVGDNGIAEYHKIPIKNELSYTKAKQWINRVDTRLLGDLICNIVGKYEDNDFTKVEVALERPMINPGRFKATVSAIRALEATLIVIEQLGLRYRYIDSKEWQKTLLPAGLEKEELKEASLQIGKRLFPGIDFKGFKDADGLLIAEHQKRKSKGG